MKKLETIKADNIVIGASLEAVLYAYIINAKLVFIREVPPTIFDVWQSKEIKLKPKEVYYKCLFLMGILGLNLGSVEKLSLDGSDGSVILFDSYGPQLRIKALRAFIFDDFQVFGLPAPVEQIEETYMIYDWFDITTKNHKFDFEKIIDHKCANGFLKEARTYRSSCVGGFLERRENKSNAKNGIVGISHLASEQILSEYFDENMARLRMLDLLEAGSDIKEEIKIEFYRRDFIPVGMSSIYDDTEFLKFNLNINPDWTYVNLIEKIRSTAIYQLYNPTNIDFLNSMKNRIQMRVLEIDSKWNRKIY
jgi:hypothetical protein